jgi:hypothetical protein
MLKQAMAGFESTHTFLARLLRDHRGVVPAFESLDYNSMLQQLSEVKRGRIEKAAAAHQQVRPGWNKRDNSDLTWLLALSSSMIIANRRGLIGRPCRQLLATLGTHLLHVQDMRPAARRRNAPIGRRPDMVWHGRYEPSTGMRILIQHKRGTS